MTWTSNGRIPRVTPRRLPRDRERFGQEVVQRLALLEAGPELVRPCAQLVIGELFDLWFEHCYGLDLSLEGLNFAALSHT